jgi:hypothetical protein
MNDMESTPVFCIFMDTICHGPVPIQRDEMGAPVVYSTRLEAERDFAEDLMDRIQQFLSGEREFADAVTVEEWVEEVDQFSDGVITDSSGNLFGPLDKVH